MDEVHKLERWDEHVKHVGDTFPVRLMITGSSSVLVSRGGRESLAGRTITSDFPTFQFGEMLEAWERIADRLPEYRFFEQLLNVDDPGEFFEGAHAMKHQQKSSLRRALEKYYNRGGYPRLYNGDVADDLWADYLTETVFNRVLGVDVPDLFPVRNPQLLRWLYVEVARSTGQEISQSRLAEDANTIGIKTSQPIIGSYLHYLSDALLIREFRRYPLTKRSSSRTPSKFTLTDLGARNAVFRGAPSLWESPPEHVGPLIETDIDNLALIEPGGILETAIQVVKPGFVIIDTLTNATRRDLCAQDQMKELKAPLVRLVQQYQTNIVLSLHLNRDGQALGRRIKGITRTLIHLECPEPEKPERLRLWVEKSYAKKPPALGVTIGESGNTYDPNAPEKSDPSRGESQDVLARCR